MHSACVRITFLTIVALVVSSTVEAAEDNVVLRWNTALLRAVRTVRSSPPVTARALAIMHTCMYDAWAAYDAVAVGTGRGAALRQPQSQRTPGNKAIAISYAAHRALNDLFPSESGAFQQLMIELGLDPAGLSLDPVDPAGVGNAACAVVLERRHHDGANQLGDMNGAAPYSDYTGYVPVNTTTELIDPNRWQPLRTATGAPQSFLAPHWRHVTPFALTAPDQFRPRPPVLFPHPGYAREVEEIVALSAGLTDRHKMIAEYWADGPASETPPGHWNLFAQFVSRRDHRGLDDDVTLFFVLGNALLDVSIAVWDCKVAFDYVRPVSAVRFLMTGQVIDAWAGPFQATRPVPAELFRSYIATPPFAEYTSGHSAFSAAGARVLQFATGSPLLNASYTFAAGSSTIEPGWTPVSKVTLTWRTFDDAADEAAMSRRFGGIHFRQGDLESRQMGKQIADRAWHKAQEYLRGTVR
jgi:hypothetical protein